MGNNCVSSMGLKEGLFQSVSDLNCWNKCSDCLVFNTGKKVTRFTTEPLKLVVQDKPPETLEIAKDDDGKPRGGLTKEEIPQERVKEETKPIAEPIREEEEEEEEEEDEAKPTTPKEPHSVERLASAGLRAESVLQTKTGHLTEHYNLGDMLGCGKFGNVFRCVEKGTGKEYACKSIAKRKLLTDYDVEAVRREIQIMHHLAGNSNVISIKGAYEDAVAVHVVMELCTGGDLFDRIFKRRRYPERKAAQLTRTIVGVVEACHSLRVMHRDLKPENFLFVNEEEDSPLKAIDFGLSVFFKPGFSLESGFMT
ncbi:hypothetical protein TIFTF001_008823 [Ficus carica]|uniref:non-specific serine/threonine protein kinase n=1 Tax=Ficus carica TaxID=3494 RepID=A0AA87ZTQ9_FICCA|nr:hypothetical protein TIFTF001_008823 [Ficus carica]